MPTEIEIESALSGKYGDVSLLARFYFADQLGNIVEDITNAVDACVIDFNAFNQVTREARFTLNQNALGDTYATSRARVLLPDKWILVKQVLNVLGTEIEYPLGLFRLSALSQMTFGENRNAKLDMIGYDPAVLLLSTTEAPYTILAGTARLTAVTSILNMFGLTKVFVEPADPTNSNNVDVDLSWPAGTPWIQIVNEVLEGFGYWPLWFSGDGTAQVKLSGLIEIASTSESRGRFAIDAVYTSDNGMLVPPISFQVDRERYPNWISVFAVNPLIVGGAGVYSINNSVPPTGYLRLGRWIKEVIDFHGSTDFGQLSKVAERKMSDAAGMAVQLTIQTVADPRRDNTRALREIYNCKADSWMDAVAGDYHRYFWSCVGWTRDVINVGSGMSHSLISMSAGSRYGVGNVT